MNLKTIVVSAALLLILVVIWLVIQGYKSRHGTVPGLDSGKLRVCQNKPNCVCSELHTTKESRIQTVELPAGNQLNSWQDVKQSIVAMGGKVEIEKQDYLAATFTSSVFGFVDDFEVRLDAEKNMIHIRSASRVGYSDFGVNRKRVTLFKTKLDELLSGQ